MLVGPDQYEEVYSNLREELQESEQKKVLVFVATDSCDSVCAVKTIQSIFLRHSIHFAIYPVSRYLEVQELCSTLLSDAQELTTLILINCGASEDVARLVDQPGTVRIIVIDSHRPFHHNFNNPGNRGLLAFCNPDDGTCDDMPEPDGSSGSEEEDGEGLEASDQEFDDNAENDSLRPNQRQRISPDSQHPGISRYSQKKQAKQERRRKRKAYYQKGATSGEPATCMLYKLANDLHLADNHLLWLRYVRRKSTPSRQLVLSITSMVARLGLWDIRQYNIVPDSPKLSLTVWTSKLPIHHHDQLWLSILGLTDHLVHQRISAELYKRWFLEHKALVSKDNIYESHTVVEVQRQDDDMPGTTTVSKPVYNKIRQMDDYCFPLMRHWTLYEAMLHSPYVAVRLQTWHDKGRRVLQEMLVKMGLPGPQFKQKWVSMEPRYQKALPGKLQEHAHKYHLLDITFKSFELAWAWRRQTASDTVHAVTALLEISTNKQDEAHDSIKDRFWRAWNALSVEQASLELKQGLELSKKLQQGILNSGGLILARNLGVQNVKRYHIWNLSNQDISNKEMMTSPTVLAKLGWFLMEARGRQINKLKDVVMISPPNADKMCLVLGVIAQTSPTRFQGNHFGPAFRAAAEDTEAQTQLDGFDSSVMLISADDVQRFVMTLNLQLGNRR